VNLNFLLFIMFYSYYHKDFLALLTVTLQRKCDVDGFIWSGSHGKEIAQAQHVKPVDCLPLHLRKVIEANPDFSYASTGVGSLNHLAMEDLKRRSGVDVLHVPYGGGGPAIAAVVGNTASLTLLSYAAVKGQITADKMKPLAVTGLKRLPDLPNTPTVAESGYAGFEAYSWIGVFAPAGTPSNTVSKLTTDFQVVLNDPEIKAKLTQGGFEVLAGDGPSAERYTKQEFDRWSQFVKTTKLKLED
jgi:tripartite-type tricarboxylate transporter receptor subunit TctC